MLSAENSGKSLGGRDSALNPAGGAHNAPPDPLAGGRGLLPLPKNATPSLALRPFSLGSPVKNPVHALGNTRL